MSQLYQLYAALRHEKKGYLLKVLVTIQPPLNPLLAKLDIAHT